ncbi:MAG: DeoR/GlpR family DNA-binding transcription regulator [Xanthomonadales bacterium]|nr:DeoR/GlpR family DNA-binding transcription regulator [Xanthomonadales bacterium]
MAKSNLHASERDARILQEVRQLPLVTVQDLADKIGSSLATVRRDLTRLANSGLVVRVHGGARLPDPPSLKGQSNVSSSSQLNVGAKQAIARHASSLCEAGDSIIIDGGSTTNAMSEYLPKSGLQILTSSFVIAERLIRQTENRVILPGGELYRQQGVILSPYDEPSVSNYFASTLFMGVLGISESGLRQSDPLLVRVEKMLIEQAERIVVLADHSKFTNKGNLRCCRLESINILVTDRNPPVQIERALLEAGVEIMLAPALSVLK